MKESVYHQLIDDLFIGIEEALGALDALDALDTLETLDRLRNFKELSA
jgi:frataxin-like iron-binding protein CyaY